MMKEEKVGSAGSNGRLQLCDETLRDGTQSLWGMMMSYHMFEPVIGEIGEAGFDSVDIPVHAGQIQINTRFFKEDSVEMFKMFREKLKNSKSNFAITGMGMMLDITGAPECVTMVKLANQLYKDWVPNINQALVMCCCQDEIKNTFPILFPMWRSMGIEPIPYFAIGHSPRHTDEFYAKAVKEVADTYKPISMCMKDVDGLLTVDRLRSLVKTFKDNSNGIPIEIHSHGMNGLNNYLFTEAMKMGIRKFTTCVPPLTYSSSHPSVYDVVRNAKELGISSNIDLEKCKVAEERLTKIGKAFGHPVENYPQTFDLTYYKHQMPGGVISNTTTQLAQLGIPEKLQEVLEEIPLILEDMGYPIMITPFSQYIVTQAVLNVQLGRWEQCLDAMIDFACGVNGVEDAGVPYMNQNLRDKLMNLPQAKKIQEKAARMLDYMNSEPTIDECKKRFGMSNDSDEDFMIKFLCHGEQEVKNITPGGPDFYKKYL